MGVYFGFPIPVIRYLIYRLMINLTKPFKRTVRIFYTFWQPKSFDKYTNSLKSLTSTLITWSANRLKIDINRTLALDFKPIWYLN